MLCNSCGKSLGERTGLCVACQSNHGKISGIHRLADNNSDSRRHILKSEEVTVFDPLAILKNPKILLALSFGGFLIIYLVLLLTHPKLGYYYSLIASIAYTCILISAGAWAKMWMELFQDNFFISMVSLFLPIGVYTMVITYPERTWKPFLIHSISGTVAIVILLIT